MMEPSQTRLIYLKFERNLSAEDLKSESDMGTRRREAFQRRSEQYERHCFKIRWATPIYGYGPAQLHDMMTKTYQTTMYIL